MSSVIEAEASVIEPDGLAVKYTPACISADFDGLEARVLEEVSVYEGARYDLSKESDARDAKRHRAYLNGIYRQIDERRKAVKSSYMAPYQEFDRRAREVAQIAKDAADGIKAQLDEAEEARRAQRLSELSEHYESYAGLLAPVVPYSALHEPRWLNKTCTDAEAQLEGKVDALASDWSALKASLSGSPYYDVAERELFSTLSLTSALRAATAAKERADALSALKGAVGHGPGERAESSCQWVVELSATRSQAEALASHLRSLGLSGRISKGSLEEIHERRRSDG